MTDNHLTMVTAGQTEPVDRREHRAQAARTEHLRRRVQLGLCTCLTCSGEKKP